MSNFFKNNSLTIVLVLCFMACMVGQIGAGWNEYNAELKELKALPVTLSQYLSSGHFVQATFENWESEFLQMSMYVLLTVFLRQRGSSESKPLEGKDEVDRIPDPKRKSAPWPVKKGGIVLAIYKNSLSIALAVLFIMSFFGHAIGSLRLYNLEQTLKHMPVETLKEYLGNSRFWFESFQNWQSEFVAVISIVVLSIFLRQYGSPESKPVDAADSETGD